MSTERDESQPIQGTYGHGSIQLTAYPSSQRVRVVLARGENHVMEMFELIQFVDQFRKPRTITTTEELKGLPNDAVILSDEGGVFQKDFGWWRETGTRDVMTDADVALPATVLYEGSAA